MTRMALTLVKERGGGGHRDLLNRRTEKNTFKTAIDPIQMTGGAQRGLTAMEAKRLPLRSRRNWNPNRKSQNYFGLQI